MNTSVLYVDFETRSPVDLKTAGLKRYAKHPKTEVLMMAWAIDDGEVRLWQQGQRVPYEIVQHIQSGGIVVAHNAQFELAIWNFILAKRHGWPFLPVEQTRCTMAACYAMALPGALEDAGRALGLPIHKDTEGRQLMLKMCKPYSYTGDPADPVPLYQDTPEMRDRLGSYCITDCNVEREIYKRVQHLSPREQQLWVVDQNINLRGIPFDMPAISGALRIAAEEKARLDAEMTLVTGGAVRACSAVAALKEWASDYGVMPESLAKVELAELLDDEILPPAVERALQLRLASSRFTSISKLKAINERHMDGRVNYTTQYHAASTGRWAGRGVQPHNFTRDLPKKPEVVEEIMEALRTGNVAALRQHGEPSTVISKCLRGFILAANGKTLMGGDFSAVEGRGLAWLAGEEWVLKAYREIDADPTLPDMYERAYAKTFNIDPNDVTDLQRQVGKVEELAFGYQGGVGAFAKMGKAAKIIIVEREITPAHIEKAKRIGGQVFTKAQADAFKEGWRKARPKTKAYWYDLERAAIAAVKEPGTVFSAGHPSRAVSFRKRGSMLWCKLPSQRVLCYPYPEIRVQNYREVLTFKGVPDSLVWATYTGQKERGETNTTYIVDDAANTKQWCRISTYGGKLAENVTQAVCRDLLAEAILRVEQAGFPVVVHVHDEIIVEGENFDGEDRLAFEMLMCEAPAWAVDFPVAAGCWLAPRYRKE